MYVTERLIIEEQILNYRLSGATRLTMFFAFFFLRIPFTTILNRY